MHTTTFYSFKGGVGRTLALANVAYELAKNGSRVLVVDFDLEAPGLDSIFARSGVESSPGVVDYVLEYISANEPPDVRRFVYPWDGLDGQDNLLVMPAGGFNESYARRLSSINWMELYEQHQGFLMFEDLKSQWKQRLNVDYVLIDSRTGHSDVTGICTRQLPDTLVILFFPNDQNLKGLVKVVRDVRSEPEATGREGIEILFVASNIPRLDDEESILGRRIGTFRTKLSTGDIGFVHRYDSLHLLDDPLFVRDRPRSQLSKEFRMIASNLRMANSEDREGAINWLEYFRTRSPHIGGAEVETKLSDLEAAHTTDGEVLFRLANARVKLGQLQEGVALFKHAIAGGFARPEVFLSCAEALQRLGERQMAAETVASVFQDSSTTLGMLYRAVEMLRLSKPELLGGLLESAAVNDLPHLERIQLATQLDRTVDERSIAYAILAPLVSRANGHEDWLRAAQFAVGSALMAMGRVHEAEESFRISLASTPDDVASVFNLAVARWALTTVPEPALFQRVLATAAPEDFRQTPNYSQCMALTHFVLGNSEEALAAMARGRQAIKRLTRPEFSCWRYLRVSQKDFLADLGEMERWMSGEPRVPQFMTAGAQLTLPALGTVR